LAFGPRLRESASVLCASIIRLHLSDLRREESLSAQERTLLPLRAGVVGLDDPRLVARREYPSRCFGWDHHLLGCFVLACFIVGSHLNISAFSPSLIYFLNLAHTDTET
jgi:hypothetical protein